MYAASLAASRLAPVLCSAPPVKLKPERRSANTGDGFPSFLPKEVEKINDSHAINLAKRIERVPVPLPVLGTETSIMSSFVRPSMQGTTEPVVLLHGFDSSCLEWRYTHPLLEEAGIESWAIDILGWGFSNLEMLPSCDAVSKRDHLFQLWSSCIKRPVVLVGPSLGAAVAIDFAVNYPEAVSKLILIDASVFAQGTGKMATLPRIVASAGVALLKSFLLRFYALKLACNELPLSTMLEWVNVKQKTLIIWGENDQVISNKLAVRLQSEMQDATLRQIPDSGHLPHVETPRAAADLIIKFVQDGYC